MPAETGLASVSVCSWRSVEADALATACFVLGEDGGIQLIRSIPETEALFIRIDGTQVWIGPHDHYNNLSVS